MKTRKDIYGEEATQMLNYITLYHNIRKEQLIKLFPKCKEGVIEKLKSTLAAIENTDIQKYPENYNMLTTDAALRSELIACRMRHLIYQSTDIKKATYLASAGVVQGIKIDDNNGILEITLPCLLPKRKKRQSTEFLIDPLLSKPTGLVYHQHDSAVYHCRTSAAYLITP